MRVFLERQKKHLGGRRGALWELLDVDDWCALQS